MSEEEKILFMKFKSDPLIEKIKNTEMANSVPPEERLISSGTELKRRK